MPMTRKEAATIAARASAATRRLTLLTRYAAALRAAGWTCTPPTTQEGTTSQWD